MSEAELRGRRTLTDSVHSGLGGAMHRTERNLGADMGEDRWVKLEEIVTRVVNKALDERGLKAKTKLAFANGEWTGVTTEQLRAWAGAYPSCDVQMELKKSAAWIVSNPDKAPKSQFARFFNTWLLRQQNASSIRSIPTRSEATQKMSCDYCGKPRTGVTSGITHCSAHLRDALDGLPVKAA